MSHKRIARIALIAALGAPSCAGGYDSMTSLRNAVDEFHDGFRWGAMGSMLPHVRDADRRTFSEGYESAMSDVSVADHEVARITMADDGNSAEVWCQISWYAEDEMIVRRATVRERWEWARPDWYRVEAVVEQGDMPGIPPAGESDETDEEPRP